MAYQVTVRLGTHTNIKFGWGYQEQAKESETVPIPVFSVLQEHHDTKINIYAEDLA